MYHFFVKNEQIDTGKIYITGEDYHHAVRVLRLRAGEEVLISDEAGHDYLCEIVPTDGAAKKASDGAEAKGADGVQSRAENAEPAECLTLFIKETRAENHELPARVWLFQGLPKSDKMELIIQKATELGVSDIVPVDMKNCVVRFEPKKAEAKCRRWQAIAESAAKQSKRSVIPTVHPVVRFTDAIRMSDSFAVKILPYENADGIGSMCEAIVSFLPDRDIAVFIGPEGGFDGMEVKLAENHGVRTVSLGKRILRTETAAIAALTMIMIRLEIASEMDFSEE